MPQRHPFLIVLAATCVSVGAAILACVPTSGCPAENASDQINVAGTYRYGGDSLIRLRGTITFEQQGNMVRVTDTTYDNSGDRPLQSNFAVLQGNRLDLALTPRNGTQYTANVRFLFSDDGNTFCAEFSDTNGDQGSLGSYSGTRQ